MARVDPFIVQLPPRLAQDPEVGPYFIYLQKFLHDLWQRSGAGQDLVDGAAQLTANQEFSGDVTFSGSIDLDGIVLLIDGTQVVGAQGAVVSDASNPSSITGYTPHSSGAVTVTSNAATDLDTTAAALDTLVDEVTSLAATVTSLVGQFNTLKDRLEAHGLIDT